MVLSDSLDGYKVDFYFLDSEYELKFCYGNRDDDELVLWNTEKSAEDFLETLQEEPRLDDARIKAQFSNPNTYGRTSYSSEAESIMNDSLFGHVEHLSTFETGEDDSIKFFDSKEFKRNIYSAELVDSERNVVALQAESLPEKTEDILEDLRPFDSTDKELKRIANELERHA